MRSAIGNRRTVRHSRIGRPLTLVCITSVTWAALVSFLPFNYYRHMNLQALLVCSDERILRVLRRVMDELEIEVEPCADPTAATKQLARLTFEAVIVDCTEERSLSLLKSIRMGQRNKKSVAVAIIDEHTALRRAFEMGAHFVIYKPISCERAKSSFRAAKALMKQEQRRSVRVPVRIPVSLRFQSGEGEQAFISGLSEGGISVELSLQCRNACVLGFRLHAARHSDSNRRCWFDRLA